MKEKKKGARGKKKPRILKVFKLGDGKREKE